MQFRGSQNEQQMFRRLFNDFQQCIKCRNGEHVHLVNDVHTFFYLGRRINRIIAQIADIINAVIRCSVDFQHIHAGTIVNASAGTAAVARIAVLRMQTVDSLCKNFGAGCLTRAAGACKQICMAHFIRHELRFDRLGHRQLADHVIKGLRTVFSI